MWTRFLLRGCFHASASTSTYRKLAIRRTTKNHWDTSHEHIHNRYLLLSILMLFEIPEPNQMKLHCNMLHDACSLLPMLGHWSMLLTFSFRSWKVWKASSLGIIISSQDCILSHYFSATAGGVVASARFASTRTRTSKWLVCTTTHYYNYDIVLFFAFLNLTLLNGFQPTLHEWFKQKCQEWWW